MGAFAQDKEGPKPIFIQKYQKPAVTSSIPTIVKKTTSQKTAVTSSNNQKSYALVDSPNPWAGTSFGRMKEEVDYYDTETGQYYNQYNYMALLAKRGDTQKLGQVANYLQLNGVFNPQQYQSTVSKALQSGNIPSVTEQAIAKNRVASASSNSSPANTSSALGPGVVQESIKKPEFVYKDTMDENTPKRLHQSYDEDMADDSAKTNKPIFLR